YITHTSGKYFQPMNVNFGIIKEFPEKIRDKRLRYEAIAKRALNDLEK
ncbi:MAG: methylenetetrahydrofolate--tRNA-(uracil(54)-C(5))-methyltransferase (FADH(2)-oxidizing) TrmFO, partial [Lactobacillales bacterium]|nr:methylenetetrahydrofolate--tRNA-(uracil(54)-C(5))-methyltransferase (FADH(2)-oxidizing) TrmFO [Lactobacillales bacterium]